MALQGDPKSLILSPKESAYAISYQLVIDSNLKRLRDIAGFLLRTTPPYSTRILAVFPLD